MPSERPAPPPPGLSREACVSEESPHAPEGGVVGQPGVIAPAKAHREGPSHP